MKVLAFLLTGILCLIPMAVAKANSSICLKDGERIVFFGDSLTKRGELPRGYITLIEEVLQRHHGPKKIATIGAGVEGNRTIDLQRRVYKDVVKKRPTLVVIFIGINDVWWGEQYPYMMTPLDEFKMRIENLAAAVAHCGAKVVLCTPPVIGEKKRGTNQLDEELDEVSSTIKKVAEQNDYVVCDLRQGFADYLATHNPEDRCKGILTVDRVHLTDAGNELVAKLMLETLGEGHDAEDKTKPL
ncbi:MAG: G-D-S-L family lipolytic protein [Candidatus Melainabacteria bacterium]|nr:MAG: G-D-S-L family lipolytic protein [Candidatus Melainabacteria bacterium]